MPASRLPLTVTSGTAAPGPPVDRGVRCAAVPPSATMERSPLAVPIAGVERRSIAFIGRAIEEG